MPFAARTVLCAAQRHGTRQGRAADAYVCHRSTSLSWSSLFGSLLQWPTLVTVVMFPILVTVYAWLAKRDEQEVRAEFEQKWDSYAARTTAFFPRLGRARCEIRRSASSGHQVRVLNWFEMLSRGFLTPPYLRQACPECSICAVIHC